MIKTLLLVAVICYLAIVAVVWTIQERLLFFPQPVFGRHVAPSGWSLEEVRITARDGTLLAGYLVKPPIERAPLLIYFGGNAEEVTSAVAESGRWGRRAVLLVNYRGYGLSAGSPSQAALLGDALEIFDWATRRPDLDPARIALHGRSLGTAVAAHVAASRPARAIVLTSPFTSIRDLARRHYPWLPVAILLRHPFDAAALAASVKVPALMISAERDLVIPPEYSERLATIWGGPVDRLSIRDRGHNDLESDPRYFATIAAFLDRHL